MRRMNKLLCVLLALLLCGCAAQGGEADTTGASESVAPTVDTAQPGTVDTTAPLSQEPEQAPTLAPVEIIMPQYTFTYSGELAELITLQEHEDGTGLLFQVRLSEQTVPVFDMFYDSQEGDYVTVLQDGQGNRVPVAFQMMQSPDGISDEDMRTFYTVQDAVNEIVASLQLQ